MTCARFAVGAVALGATVAVALQDVIKECCTRAHAQTQTASPEPTVWDHNGSVMYLVADGSSREIYYKSPAQECWRRARVRAPFYSAVK
jgi:hypothetical protein